jgi:hypothetical protein
MPTIRVCERFKAPPEQVWERYVNYPSWSEWGGFNTIRIEQQGKRDPFGAGCVRVVPVFPFRIREEILEFDAPLIGGGPTKNHVGTVTLAREGDQTELIWEVRCDARVPGMGPVIAVSTRRIFARALAGLKRELERI